MSLEDEILAALENPAQIEDLESRELMETAEKHYMESLEAESQNIVEYERELAKEKLELYDQAQALEKNSSQYQF